ncbi:hypothetical protein FKG94_24385 [Exilibacterium tricleocarpae]|uniref:Uncharacterized protein n=1 Tax=Exilibacterium tricleocarpae TaxID=2591008 RepID=A0A545SSQ8_9GAMM|nr:hypothetical protein [Exilibacterium tricleocarpae]TQV67976.1 hypothetical protein FKG94_24385 [Exilibacterium tricleocarpae]
MTFDEFQTWQMVFTLCAVSAVTAYAVLLLQSLFHDVRIGIAGLFGGLACAVLSVIADSVYLFAAVIVGLLIFGFTVFAVMNNIKQPKFWVPLAIFTLTAPGAYGAYWYLNTATAAS